MFQTIGNHRQMLLCCYNQHLDSAAMQNTYILFSPTVHIRSSVLKNIYIYIYTLRSICSKRINRPYIVIYIRTLYWIPKRASVVFYSVEGVHLLINIYVCVYIYVCVCVCVCVSGYVLRVTH